MRTRSSLWVSLAILALGACHRDILVGAHAGTGGAGKGGGGDGGAGNGGANCTPLPSIQRRLWRLTTEQYANSVREILALDNAPVVPASPDDGSSSGAFLNGPELTIQPAYLIASLYATAGAVVTRIAPRVSDTCAGSDCIVTCEAAEAHATCATRFAQSFGSKVFRRPLESDEVTSLMRVYGAVCPLPSPDCASSSDFSAAISLMVKALILAPSFLYRTELGPATLLADAAGHFPDTTLTPYEVATQLAFLLSNSTPDAGLRAAAADGSLGTSAGIAREVNRLMALPAVQQNLAHAVTNWFGIGQLPAHVGKDPALLSPLAPADQDQAAIVSELQASAEVQVADALWASPAGKVTDLLTSSKAFLTDRLATLYGLPAAGTGTNALAAFSWPAAEQRSGLLSHPAFLWALSDPPAGSIIRRGELIHDRLLCQDPLPPNIDLTSPGAAAISSLGNSDATRSQARLQSGSVCRACHVQMDSYGALLQGFDPIGRHRTADEVGAPIDLAVTFEAPSPLAPMTISGPTGLASAMIATNAFAGCAVQQLGSYAIGAPIQPSNTCEIDALRTQFDQTDGTMASLLRTILVADFVRARAGGVQ